MFRRPVGVCLSLANICWACKMMARDFKVNNPGTLHKADDVAQSVGILIISISILQHHFVKIIGERKTKSLASILLPGTMETHDFEDK